MYENINHDSIVGIISKSKGVFLVEEAASA